MNTLLAEIGGLELHALFLATAVFTGCSLTLLTLKRWGVHRLASLGAEGSRTAALLGGVLVGTRSAFLYFLAVCAGLQVLEIPDRLTHMVDALASAAVLLQMALWCNAAIAAWLQQARRPIDSGAEAGTEAAHITGSMAVLGFLAKLAVWTIVFLLFLDNLGVDITALVASLGIGGIAVALAVQNVLGDVLASLAIVLDKPFQTGDFIVADDTLGTVEYIGVKTTRLRSLSGEQVICANADLLKTRIRNFKRMAERRIRFGFGIVYQTAADVVEQIPEMVRGVVEAQPDTRFERAHLLAFGESALEFEVVFHVLDPDYNRYMDVQQAINIGLMRRFEREGINFAYPTRTLLIPRAVEA